MNLYYWLTNYLKGLITGVMPKHLIQQTKATNKSSQDAIPIQHDTSKVNYFRSSDLEKLNHQLDNSLLFSDTSSSRASRNSNASDRKSTYSSASIDSKSSIHSQPWKPV